MSLRKGKNLDLPLRLIGLKVGRKGPWKTPRPTWSSDKRGSPDSEIRSHLPKVTEVGRGRARLSPSPVLSTALLYLLSSAELSTSRRPPTFSDWLKDTRKGSAEPDTLPEQALAPRLKATTPCTSPPCHTGHTWRGLTPCGARTHAEPLRGIRVRLRQLPFHVRLGVLSKRLIRCHEATCCWAKRRFLVDSWPGQAGQSVPPGSPPGSCSDRGPEAGAPEGEDGVEPLRATLRVSSSAGAQRLPPCTVDHASQRRTCLL